MTTQTTTDQHFRLSSGMGLTLLRRPGTTFGAALAIPGGFRQDPQETTGLNHLLEHLAFAGKAAEPVAALSRRGMDVNGWTSMEQATFWTSGQAEQCGEGITFLRSLLGTPTFTADELKHEFEVVRQEVAGRIYTVWDYHRDVLAGLLAGDPRGWLGTLSNLEGLTKMSYEEVRKAATRRMVPENAWLIVASPDPEADVAKALGDDDRWQDAVSLPEEEIGDVAEVDPPALPSAYIARIKKSDQTALYRYAHYRPPGVFRGAAIAILCDILGGGPYGELAKRFRQDQPLSYDTSIVSLPLYDCVVIALSVVVDRKKDEVALGILNDLTRHIREQGVDETLLEESRSRLLTSFRSMNERAEAVCSFMSDRVLVPLPGEDPSKPSSCGAPFPATYEHRMQTLTLDILNTAAAGLLRPERTLTAILGDVKWLRRKRLAKLAEHG